MNVIFTQGFRSIQDLTAIDTSSSHEDGLSPDQTKKALEVIRQTETPATEVMSRYSISPSFATTHLNSLEENLEINQITKILSLIEQSYRSELSIPLDPYHRTTWLDLFKDPQHAGSRQHDHHKNVCFCFLFAVAIDASLDTADKIRMVQETLSTLTLDHSFDLDNSLAGLPPLMVVFILPYILEDFKQSVLAKASDPSLLRSWISVIFEHSNTWPESTQKTILKSLNAESFPSTRAFRIHTSAAFKHWLSLISRVSTPAPLHPSETVESFESFISSIRPNAPSQRQEYDAIDSLLELSPAAAIATLVHSSTDIQKQVFNIVSDPETLNLWVEAAFEYQRSIGPDVLALIALHVKNPSFPPYFQRMAALEVQAWAESINPKFFPSAYRHDSCHCIVS